MFTMQPKMGWPLENSRLPKPTCTLSSKKGHIKQVDQNSHKDIIKRNLRVINIPLNDWQYLSKIHKTEGKNQWDIIIGNGRQFVKAVNKIYMI